ncbi:MAG: hydrogenase iron-sulfur subunit [Deltaproteobacteria bacterium]|nr:hydrogenase iron-sulfur subunit [Candidatus Anaeroferrophillus wilburensis]MBN2890044.1 hydrogenase iron-sulfur subunit [Deltaproteobacteria bacterium]
MSENFEPRIVAFLCHWCTYTGADLAGTTRQQYPSGIRVIHLMCSGAIDVVYVLKAILEGADGVMIGGCHPGDCHYQSGNFKARRRIALLREIMACLGMDADRVWLRWISASEGRLFVETVREFSGALEEQGANPLAQEWDI